MQLTAKISNRNVNWSALLKPRVGTTVTQNGSIYSNVSGFNGDLTDTNHWYALFVPPAAVGEINKTSADVLGTDPDFYLDLTSTAIPAFPLVLKVWIKLNNGANYEPVEPVNYSPETRLLGGMNDPTAFPDQMIKIKFL